MAGRLRATIPKEQVLGTMLSCYCFRFDDLTIHVVRVLIGISGCFLPRLVRFCIVFPHILYLFQPVLLCISYKLAYIHTYQRQ